MTEWPCNWINAHKKQVQPKNDDKENLLGPEKTLKRKNHQQSYKLKNGSVNRLYVTD